MKSLFIFSFLVSATFAQDKMEFKTQAERDKWNQYGLPLGTNKTLYLYPVASTNALTVLITTNDTTKLKSDGRITSTNTPIIPK